jgi:hypothetical protein
MSIVKYTKTAFSVFFLVMLWGCTEEIDLKLNSTYRRLVVDGVITTDTTSHYVKLTYSGDYFQNDPMAGVSNATVVINDGEGEVELTESANVKGLYLTPPDYYGVEGRTYSLTISNVDVDGNGEMETYTSQSYLSPVVKVDSVGIGFHKIYNLWQILLYAKDPIERENFYMFKVFRNDSLISDAYDEVVVADDMLFDGNDVNGVWVVALDANEPAEDLKKGDKVTLVMNSIDKPFFDFLTALQVETTPRNPLFSGAPANIPGNISNGALGVFAAYSTSSAQAIVPKDKNEY